MRNMAFRLRILWGTGEKKLKVLDSPFWVISTEQNER